MNAQYFKEANFVINNIKKGDRNIQDCVCVLSHVSYVQLFAILRSATHQTPLSMGILQTRILEWIAMPSCRGSCQLRDRNRISHI